MKNLRLKIYKILEPHLGEIKSTPVLNEIMDLIEGKNDEVKIDVIMQIVMSYHTKIRSLRTRNSIPYLPPKAKAKVIQRLREYSFEELIDAIDRFSGDSWWMEHNSRRPLEWFFHSYERIEQFLQLESSKGNHKWKVGDKEYSLEELKLAEEKGEVHYEEGRGYVS